MTGSPSPALHADLGSRVAAGRKLLIPFLTAGFPDLHTTRAVLDQLAACGVDAIELGVPFSDPLADGPVIARASERALAGGVSLGSVLEISADYWTESRPRVVLFTYLNPLLAITIETVADRCARCSVGGVLVADLPFDEDPGLGRALASRGIPLIRLAAPTTPPARLRQLTDGATGFIYLIARTGVTGSGAGTDQRVREQVGVLRQETSIPVVIGFGIDDIDAARRAAEIADGVVIGSAFVRRIEVEGADRAVEWMARFRNALDAG